MEKALLTGRLFCFVIIGKHIHFPSTSLQLLPNQSTASLNFSMNYCLFAATKKDMIKTTYWLLFLLTFITNATAQNRTFLPKPTGEYFVGTENLFLTDSSRNEKLTLKWGDKRSLQLKIWYPSDVKGEKENLYLKDYAGKVLWENYRIFNDDKSFFDSIKTYSTFSYENIPISNKQKSFPLIVFSQGYYFGLDDFYTALMENLASHGYIVVSITHPYDQVITNRPDGSVVNIKKYRVMKAYMQWKKVEFMHKKNPDTANTRQVNRILKAYLRGMRIFKKSVRIWTKDARFVMDTLQKINDNSTNNRWYGKIDFSKVATMGQSVGGAVAGQICYVDERVKAAVNLDCFQFGDLYQHEMKKPVLLLQSDMYPLWAIGNKVIYSKTEPFYSIKLKDTRHFIFSDCCLFPVEHNKKMRYLIGPGKIMENVVLINQYITSFYDHHLKGLSLEPGALPTNQ